MSLRVQVSPTRFRVPDVTALDQDAPNEQVITHPPLIVFEILSPQDTVTRMLIKWADCAGMGSKGIFVIDPAMDTYYAYQQGSLDHIGGPRTVGHCQIDFDEIKGLLAWTQQHSGSETIA